MWTFLKGSFCSSKILHFATIGFPWWSLGQSFTLSVKPVKEKNCVIFFSSFGWFFPYNKKRRQSFVCGKLECLSCVVPTYEGLVLYVSKMSPHTGMCDLCLNRYCCHQSTGELIKIPKDSSGCFSFFFSFCIVVVCLLCDSNHIIYQ